MKGGIARWKRGVSGTGVRKALAYALQGECDAHLEEHHLEPAPMSAAEGVARAEAYAADRTYRYTVVDGEISVDALDRAQLRTWINGDDPETGATRGHARETPDADLLLDATVNAPKTFSLAAILNPELSAEFEALMDRVRDQTMLMWQRELNTRRGRNGAQLMELSRIEVVELRHERSRSLDPHKHRHLWLNIKTQGADGKWSRIDSRVALRFHNVVNAAGELAARTDPRWVAALAAAGYTLDANGEIEQLAHLVRPLSRRSNQIEANRQARLAQWREAHPGQEPSPKDLQAIDRWAWAYGRPNKPQELDESDWAAQVRSEIAAIDTSAVKARRPVNVSARAEAAMAEQLEALLSGQDDRGIAYFAELAVANADRRSMSNGGRFSPWDVRAGALRAVAASGIVADRSALDRIVATVTETAMAEHVYALVAGDAENMTGQGVVMPQQVKGLMSTATFKLKLQLQANLDRLAALGHDRPAHSDSDRFLLDADIVATISKRTLKEHEQLNAGQARAAAAIAGTGRLVAVTGPAGTGKTTMLKVATTALTGQGRQALLLAPTLKAAQVMGRETGMDAASVHRFLMDHGWNAEPSGPGGQTQWHHTPVGTEIDLFDDKGKKTGTYTYKGPKYFPISKGTQIIVDEAGMLDADTARVLSAVVLEHGASLTLMGDPKQVSPVGHSGAMEIARRTANVSVELDEVHRFQIRVENAGQDQAARIPNTDYAHLTLRMREASTPQEAREVATTLVDGIQGASVRAATSLRDAQEQAVKAYLGATAQGSKSEKAAIVTSTNEEAQLLNDAIQQHRVDTGSLDPKRAGYGQNGQRLLIGDRVQTRLNDRDLDVQNRAVWVIDRIGRDNSLVLRDPEDPARTRKVPARYVEQNVHLAYASTVHGIQGETVDHAIVMPGVDAAGVYVGMTRGRHMNEIITLGQTRDAQITEIAEAIVTDNEAATVHDAKAAAQADYDRAAKPVDETPALPVEIPTPAWDDHRARPYGRATDLASLLHNDQMVLVEKRDAMTDVADRIEIHKRTLTELRQRAATAEATHQAGRVAEFAGLIAKTEERLGEANEEMKQRNREFRLAAANLNNAEQEALWRQVAPDPNQIAAIRHAILRTQARAGSPDPNTGPVVGSAPSSGRREPRW